MSSLTNKIIGNIKRISTDFNSSLYTDSNNVIAIDTLNNRIGINTKDPSYSLHIVSTTDTGIIKSDKIIIENLAEIKEINSNDISTNNILCIDGNINTLISAQINTNSLIVTDDISLSFETISGDEINANTISTDNLTVNNELTIPLIVNTSISGDITSYNTISGEGNINSNYIYSNNSYSDTFYANRTGTGTSNYFNDNGLTIYNGRIDCDTTSESFINKFSSNSINSISYKIDNNTLITITEDTENKDYFNFGFEISNNLDIYTQNIKVNDGLMSPNILFTNLLHSSPNSEIDFNNSKLILPNKNNIDIYDLSDGSIFYDYSLNILNIYNNSNFNKISIDKNYATIKYDNSLNDISLGNYNNLHYKHLSIQFDTSYSNIFDISNSKTLLINNLNDNSNNIFNINANISLQYYNQDNNSIIVNNYIFGIYPNYPDDISNSINNCFVKNRNNIISIDNSNNYANSSINYIGELFKNKDYDNANGFNFFIAAPNDLDNLIINSLNITVL